MPGGAAQGDGDARHPGTAAARAGNHDDVEKHARRKVRPEGAQHDAALASALTAPQFTAHSLFSHTNGKAALMPWRVPTLMALVMVEQVHGPQTDHRRDTRVVHIPLGLAWRPASVVQVLPMSALHRHSCMPAVHIM